MVIVLLLAAWSQNTMIPDWYRNLSVLSEIGQAQRLRGLLVPLVSQGRNDQHDDGNHIGEHLVQFLDSKIHAGGDVHMEDIETAKQVRCQNTHIGTPYGKDNQQSQQNAV